MMLFGEWTAMCSVVDLHHFDADPDSYFYLMRIRIRLRLLNPDATFHPDADPYLDPNYKKRLKPLKKC
jgi:hypothetical protein